MIRWILVLVFVPMSTACGVPANENLAAPASSQTPAELPALVTGTGTVLQTSDGNPELCLGAIMESLPPQCSGLRIDGWDWDDVDDEEEASGTMWGTYSVAGRFDGRTMTLVEPARPPARHHQPEPEITTPCAEPEDGWDPGGTQEDVQAASAYAQRQPDFAGLWVDHIGDPSEEELSPVVLTVAFTGRLATHEAKLTELWDGPLCVVQFKRTLHQLEKIQSELHEGFADLGYGSTFSQINTTENTVAFGVVFATDELRGELNERFGPGVVQVHSALIPVD